MLLRGVPVGVVYTGNNVIFKTIIMAPTTDSNGKQTVRSQNNFGDDNARLGK